MHKILKKNIDELKIDNFSTIFEKSAYDISEVDIQYQKLDLVFLDPPFKDKNINDLLQIIKKLNILNKDTLFVIHRNKKTIDKFGKDFLVLREQKYGLSKIIFGKFLL